MMAGQEAAPWFRRPDPVPPGAAVAVVGAGVAGCAAAGALRQAGYAVTLIDRAGCLGAEASGNPCGLLKPRLTADGGVHGRFYGQGFLHAVETLDRLGGWLSRGILSVARNDDEAATMRRLAGTLPAEHLRFVGAAEAGALAGVSAPLGGLWFPHAGAIAPRAVCAALAGGTAVRAAAVDSLEAVAEGWRLLADGVEVARAAAVVLAAGPWTPRLWPAADLPIHANRGHITLLPEAAGAPPVALSFGGYLAPAVAEGRHVLGATYGRVPDPRDDGWRAPRPEDDAATLGLLAEVLPDVHARMGEPCGGRVSLRATIADHLPVMGPLFDAAAWRRAYADLHHGRPWRSYPPAPLAGGLFVLGGLGSRGFQTAPLLAAALAALVAGTPGPLAPDLLEAVHPGRFVLRSLRRPPKGAGAGRVTRSAAATTPSV
ncbi:FAD-dependent 5-carboxymethylaminomethyl-2-thiouridine(34) oxidoreductase MnmC [Novispirillum sp. DQ9]|uniref:FAD-dependent 5-carboxymethylaminomethyl-2-thiouridine(34) oxidoreductase MnmC n=1 Tax=Novispirillum sp. DQ9 TaxID=3398612 RepID=UPI003C7C574C